MKRINKGQEPRSLEQYRAANPTSNWKLCVADQDRRDEIQNHLRQDQGGICCYCEIDLIPANVGKADFRVEHFHPKSDTSTEFNWHLDWQNLFCCCHGGSEKYVNSAEARFTSPDTSCDVPKEDNDWDSLIFKPSDLPAFPGIFKFHRVDGSDQISIEVDDKGCTAAGVDLTIAKQTIDMLKLDAPRLKRLRKVELDYLNEIVERSLEAGKEIEEILRELTLSQLVKDEDGNWPSFFSAKRSYLGHAAEQHLRTTGYNG
ncbi:hypothetical protein RvVAR0630_09940 [Agrobacterium vitis]|uniref:retron system putative HNH endonuclease n=1 Tax=Agrobacterium vitis TaxID=373 RepID=UPI0015D7FF52|nr:retron system putative HNH endonuclease [Agrobacterium vitis]BCH58370.1 hypothetical protein RvVAR0630_09940 [Agrobacterium vitis]